MANKGIHKTICCLLIALIITNMSILNYIIIKPIYAEGSLPKREIKVYIINIPEIPASKVNNMINAYMGVLKAINNSKNKMRIKLFDDVYTITKITSLDQLKSLILNPPKLAIIINLHGEILPIPFVFAQNDAESGGDAGDSISSATPISSGTYHGYLEKVGSILGNWDSVDCYKFYVDANERIEIELDVPNTGDFDLYLYSPGGRLVASSPNPGYGLSESIIYPADVSGWWIVKVKRQSGYGEYTLTLDITSDIPSPPGGGCPFVYTWNGSSYVIDNNILPLSERYASKVYDVYVLQQKLVPLNGKDVYSIMISEFEKEISFIDSVELLAAENQAGSLIVSTVEGSIISVKKIILPECVNINGSRNKEVLSLISSVDNNYFEASPNMTMTIKFNIDNITNKAFLIIRSDYFEKYSIYVQVKNRYGIWQTITIITPRKYWAYDAVNLSCFINNSSKNLDVRLIFTASHKIDFIGLATEVEQPHVINGRLIKALHSVLGNVKKLVMHNDNLYTIITPGDKLRLYYKFKLESNKTYTYVLRIYGKYISLNPLLTQFKAKIKIKDPPSWEKWIDLIRNAISSYGIIWVHIAGAPFYYVYNPDTCKLYTIGNAGFSRVFLKDLTITRLNEPKTAVILNELVHRPVFKQIYDLPSELKASCIIPTSEKLYYQLIGYGSFNPDGIAVAAIAINKTDDFNTISGLFVFEGLDTYASTQSSIDHDWLKGYIGTAIALEHRKAILMFPQRVSKFIHGAELNLNSILNACFLVMLVPGNYCIKFVPEEGYRAVLYLILALRAHFPYLYDQLPAPDFVYYEALYLSYADVFGSSDYDLSYFTIIPSKIGVETGDKNIELMRNLAWWALAILAGSVPYVGKILGPLVSLIPIVVKYTTPELEISCDTKEGYAKNIDYDPDDDTWGTCIVLMKIIFKKPNDSVTQTLSSFSITMKAWVCDKLCSAINNNYDCAVFEKVFPILIVWE